MRLELYLLMAGVTVSQTDAVRFLHLPATASYTSLICVRRRAVLRVIRLIVLIVGDVYTMSCLSQSRLGMRDTGRSIAFRRSTSLHWNAC
jgi:hypothetical protein